MLRPVPSLGAGLGLVFALGATLLVIWWRQQSRRWVIVLAVSLSAAPALSWWSGQVFQVADYRAGCAGLCPGFRGAPFVVYNGEAAGGAFLPGGFLLNTLLFLVILLAWGAVVRAVIHGLTAGANRAVWRVVVVGLILGVAPFAFSPWFLPPPEAHVRGDSLRVAINARREVFMYDHQVPWPVLRVGLEDVRPRPDGEPGLRVCLRTYTFFYMPTGALYLDMTRQGVHSNRGGFVLPSASCWE